MRANVVTERRENKSKSNNINIIKSRASQDIKHFLSPKMTE